MKKTTLLLAICFAFQFNAMSQVLVPDNVFEQKLLDAAIDTDGLLNGQISTVVAEAVTGTLNLAFAGLGSVADFTGVEGFINITGLNASYNEAATSLDVSGIAGLTSVDIEGCILITTLTTTG